MIDFQHRVLSPYEVSQSFPMGESPVRFRAQLLEAWLIDRTGNGTETLFPARTCTGLSGEWVPEVSGFSSHEMGVDAVPGHTIAQLNTTAVERVTPEPLARIARSGSGIVHIIGYGVEGMGQRFDALFYQGMSNIRDLPTPPNYWVLRSVRLATDGLER